MIADAAAIEQLANAPAGDLGTTPFPLILVAYAVHRRTAMLEVRSGPVAKRITFVDGPPVDCSSNLVSDTLARFLLARGLLNEGQISECEAEVRSTGRSLEDILLSRGLLDESALGRVLQQNLARKLFDAFAWRRGSFNVSPLTSIPASTLKVKVSQLVVIGIQKFASEEQISEAFGPLVGRPLYLNSRPLLPFSELRLNDQQNRMIDGLRVGRRVDELAADGLDPASVMRSLYALAVLGHVATEPQAVATEPPRSTLAPGVQAPPLARSADPPTTTVDREWMTLVHQRMGTIDAFDLLEVAPTVSPPQVDDAFLRFAERVQPWSIATADPLAAKARELFLAGSRAHAELSDSVRRSSLLARRQGRPSSGAASVATTEPVKVPAFSFDLRTPAAARDAFRIETELLDPDQQYRRGLKFMEKERYSEAIEQLQYAVDCDPQNSAYRAELARCHYLSSPSTRSATAIRELEEAVRVDPDCGIALFYLGDILGAAGRLDEAVEPLKRAARLMLPDRRALDRLNTLRAPQPKKGLWPRPKG